jgi:hypothetical protein
MRILTALFLSALFLIGVSIGCAHIGSTPKELTIDEIAGSWENIHFGYIYLYIDESGKGYFIPGLDENEEDKYKIDSLSFSGRTVIVNLTSIGDTKDEIKAECYLFGKDMLVFNPMDKNEKEEAFIFMRESKVNKSREKAKDFINSKGLGT